MDLCPFEILERDELHVASLDSVCPCFVNGADMKYSSLDGEAWLETVYLPALDYPQLLLNLKIKQDPAFSFPILSFFFPFC